MLLQEKKKIFLFQFIVSVRSWYIEYILYLFMVCINNNNCSARSKNKFNGTDVYLIIADLLTKCNKEDRVSYVLEGKVRTFNSTPLKSSDQ